MFEEFIQYHTELVDMINKQIESSSSPIFLFGGHIFSQFLIGFGLNVENIINILDNSDIKHNKRLYGTNLIVKSPKILKEYQKPIVILKAGVYNDEIKTDILSHVNCETVFI